MDISTITKLNKIFNIKKWNKNDGNEIVFDNFCKLLVNLSKSQRDLIIELTERYTWITFSEYSSQLINILKTVDNEKLKLLKRIIFFPIMKPEDVGVTKSGHMILYMVLALKPLLIPEYKHITFSRKETFEEITNDGFTVNDGEAIFLLDDYLGSGETLEATLTEILKNKKIIPTNLFVISISSQKESLDYINRLGVSVYIGHVSKKGISDYYLSPVLEEKTKIMLEIEKLIPDNHFSFGYKSSEALITLIKTPDNTFPIFWKDYKKNGKKFEAPFARYQE